MRQDQHRSNLEQERVWKRKGRWWHQREKKQTKVGDGKVGEKIRRKNSSASPHELQKKM
jgi:hypothetical protein